MISRDAALAALAEESFDVVVVGGGITGAGVALDAATRGYSVALVERRDFAAGTSSRSSKLVHGGLRYLQKFDLGLVREALLERRLLVSLAPHLVRPLQLVVPSFGGKRPDRMLGTGLHLYDVMARERRRGAEDEEWSPARHRIIDGDEVRELVPAIATREPTAGYLFYDCQTDDVRLVLTVLGEAERFGAVLANRLEVTGLIHDAGGRACGVKCRDTIGGGELDVRAETVVNATGVWADRISPAEFYEEEDVPRIRPSRGTHLLVDRERLPVEAGAIVPAAGGRTIFVLPWLGRTLIGTTDNDYEGQLEHIAPDRLPEMIKLAASRLQRNGVIAIETPNPECLAIFATHFYLDPTHQRPVPHPLLAFYLEEFGVGNIEVRRLSPAVESMPTVASLPEDFREAFFGGLDYAITGKKL